MGSKVLNANDIALGITNRRQKVVCVATLFSHAGVYRPWSKDNDMNEREWAKKAKLEMEQKSNPSSKQQSKDVNGPVKELPCKRPSDALYHTGNLDPSFSTEQDFLNKLISRD